MIRSWRWGTAALLIFTAIAVSRLLSEFWITQLQPESVSAVAVRQLHSNEASAAMRSVSAVQVLVPWVCHLAAAAVCLAAVSWASAVSAQKGTGEVG